MQIGEKTSQETIECPYEPSPLGVPLEGFAVTSPLTGSLMSYNYTLEAGAPGLAQFLCKEEGFITVY